MIINIKNGKLDLSEKNFIFITIFNSFFVSICNKLPNGSLISLVVSFIIVLWAFFYRKFRLPVMHIIVFFVLFILSFLNCLIFNVDMTGYVMTYLFCYIPMIIAAGIINFEKHKQFIFRVSCVYIGFLFIYMIFNYTKVSTVHSDFIDYMGFAYYALPALLFIVYHFFEYRDKLSMILCIVGAIYLIICGTRGPILCAMVYVVYSIFNDLKERKMKNIIFITFIAIILIAFLLNIKEIATYLYPIFQRNGFSTRFLLYFIKNNNMLSFEGRDVIHDTVYESINSHFVFGAGLLGDRKLFGEENTDYSHNLFLELLHSFGVPLGGFLSLALMFLIVFAYKRSQSKTYKNYIAIYFCAAIVKLFFSSSFMQESTLFILIGLCIRVLHIRKKWEIVYCRW